VSPNCVEILTGLVHRAAVASGLTNSRNPPAPPRTPSSPLPSDLPSATDTRASGAGAADIQRQLARYAFRYEHCDVPAGLPLKAWQRPGKS
jgi:hypothetical protein